MISRGVEFARRNWRVFCSTPFGCLVRLFVSRMFHGGGEPGAEELGLGIGVVVILSAMPGTLVSLLMLEKYGSLIRFLSGQRAFDPFAAIAPDEYFFIVLSMVVTGAAALWRWDSIFLDRRDYSNLVPLPVSLSTIFFANLFAIFAFALLFTFTVNASSLVLFPIAVVGSQGSLLVFVHFAAGHAASVFLASAFGFFAVFAVAGLLMALLPSGAFRRVSLPARFAVAVGLLALLASSFTLLDQLKRVSVASAHAIAVLPPVSFLGVARTLWGRTRDPFSSAMSHAALSGIAVAVLVAILGYAISFRRFFLRVPEMADTGPLPRTSLSLSRFFPRRKNAPPASRLQACFSFVVKTMMRSDGHLQIVLAFAAIGLVVAAESLTSAPHPYYVLKENVPPVEFLSAAFILAYCGILGMCFSFEMPADLRANWIFQLWLDPAQDSARIIARRALLVFSLSWLAPLTFILTLLSWGWTQALLHTAILVACTITLIELLLVRFRKIPFTCSYPSFQSHSGVVFVAYLLGFVVFTGYLPDMEHWCLYSPWQTLWFVPPLGAVVFGLRQYRRQMLDMDKRLIFEESASSTF